MAYRYEDRSDRWKAISAVFVIHVLLGAAILTGLNVEIVHRAVDRLQTFDISLPEIPPPPPPPPPPKVKEQEESGSPAAPKASPIVAPKPEIQLPVKQTIAAAREAGTGASSSTGQGGAGTGTGAGGTGTGRGSGSGSGSGAGFTPAQRIKKIPDREYRRFVAISGMRRGTVGISIKVNTDGAPSNCRVVRSSGSPAADSLMCELTLRYVRFRPARDPQGRPVAQDLSWYPNWFQ